MEKNWAKLFIFMIEKTNVGEKKVNLQRRKNQIGLRHLRLMEDNRAWLEENFPKYFLLQQVPRNSPSSKKRFCFEDIEP